MGVSARHEGDNRCAGDEGDPTGARRDVRCVANDRFGSLTGAFIYSQSKENTFGTIEWPL